MQKYKLIVYFKISNNYVSKMIKSFDDSIFFFLEGGGRVGGCFWYVLKIRVNFGLNISVKAHSKHECSFTSVLPLNIC